ncbi:MAG TPA: AbiH family protein [Flavobacterium sp.]|jgi:hypothetical protein
MNRLIILGNGFDLAHNLKTSYSDFLKYYWSQVKDNYDDGLIRFKSLHLTKTCYSLQEVEIMKLAANKYTHNTIIFEVQNKFFLKLNRNCSGGNWVDIEMFYYQCLKAHFPAHNLQAIKKLNDEFEAVKLQFESYISHVVNSTENLSDHLVPEMCKIFQPIHDGSKYNFRLLNKLRDKVRMKVEDESSIRTVNERTFQIDPLTSHVHVLNFNYTKTISMYFEALEENQNFRVNYIHGEADNRQNPVVFGFGDERDKFFSDLEDINENEYLRFMKSNAYLQTLNYHNLLNFIESGSYIIEILGHSCGLSDRTLLKTIFENINCVHIFMAYHLRKDGTDNFTDLSLNISRHFDDKIMMRSKVANKRFCDPLPQFLEML